MEKLEDMPSPSPNKQKRKGGVPKSISSKQERAKNNNKETVPYWVAFDPVWTIEDYSIERKKEKHGMYLL